MRFIYPWAGIGIIVIIGLLWFLRYQWTQRMGLDRAAFVVRALALVALVVTLAGPQSASREAVRYVYFVVDRSASTSLSSGDGIVMQTLSQFEQADERTRYGVIAYGKDAFIDQPFSSNLPVALQTTVDPSASDMAGALRLALETLPAGLEQSGEGSNIDIVLLSDGQSDAQSLLGVLERARDMGVRIWIRPLGDRTYADVRLDSVQLPREVTPDRRFEGVAYVYANEPTTGDLLIYRDDQLLEAVPTQLEVGVNSLTFFDELEEPGHYRYQVRFKADNDVLLENNIASDLVTVSGSAALLLYERPDGNGEGLSRLLDAAGFTHERRVWSNPTFNLSELASYKGIILNNVPLEQLTSEGIDTLKAYASQLGGGVWVIEGQQALEGVNQSEIEEMLPVTFEGPQQDQLPGVAIVFILDRSSSMGQSAVAGSGLNKLDVLKEAAAQSIEVLREEDNIGIVVFDSSSDWLVDLQVLGNQQNRQRIYSLIQQIHAGGGTDMHKPLMDAMDQLRRVPARIKHILVFSDGKTVRQDRDYQDLFNQLVGSDITVSSIGLGQQPDEEMLNQLADAGQGEVFMVRDVTQLPKISVRETRRIVQRRWVVGNFATEQGPYGQLRLSGFDINSMPPVSGYVQTYAKDLSQSAMTVEGNPLLSFWQYGLGQVAVLNTDLEGVWTDQWSGWSRLSELVGEVMSQLYANPESNAGLVLRSEVDGNKLHLRLDATDGTRFVNQLEIAGQLHSDEAGNEDGESMPIQFTQVAPGQYEATVENVKQGLSLVNLEAIQEGELATQQTHVVAVPYPLEYQNLGINDALLRQIADTTGGKVLEDEQIDLGPIGRAGHVRYEDLWPIGLSIAMFLFLSDLLLRKVPLEALLRRGE